MKQVRIFCTRCKTFFVIRLSSLKELVKCPKCKKSDMLEFPERQEWATGPNHKSRSVLAYLSASQCSPPITPTVLTNYGESFLYRRDNFIHWRRVACGPFSIFCPVERYILANITLGGIKPSSLLPRSPNDMVRRSARWPYVSFARSLKHHASLASRVRPCHGCRQSNTCRIRLFGRLVLCTLT